MRLQVGLFLAALALGSVQSASAVTYYWKGATGNFNWGASASWADNATGTPTSTSFPDSDDIAHFSVSGLSGSSTTPDLQTNQSALGLVYDSERTVNLRGGTTANGTLSLGASGILMTGSGGNLTLGTSTANSSLNNVLMGIAADQSWTNNKSGGSLIVRNGIIPEGGNRTLTLSGTSTAAGNEILSTFSHAGWNGTIRDNGSFTLALEKTGTGNWKISTGATALTQNTFSGGVTVTQGILELNNGSSLLASGAVTSGPLGTGILTMNGGTLRTQTAAGSNSLGNNVTLEDVTGSTFSLTSTGSTTLSGVLSGDGGFTKTGSGVLVLTNDNTYEGNTVINAGGTTGALNLVNASSTNNIPNSAQITVNGILNVTGLQAGTFASTSSQTIAGSGFVNGIIGGAGLVSPGNSPGILSTLATNPTGGLDYAFEMTALGDPTWSNNLASVNDVLRLVDPTTPITAALDSDNTVSVNFAIALSAGDVIRGGFYTDANSDFSALVSGADWDFTFTSGSIPSGYMIAPSVTQVVSANFASGPVSNGWVTTFSVIPVPEPGSIALIVIGLIGVATQRRRIRKS